MRLLCYNSFHWCWFCFLFSSFSQNGSSVFVQLIVFFLSFPLPLPQQTYTNLNILSAFHLHKLTLWSSRDIFKRSILSYLQRICFRIILTSNPHSFSRRRTKKKKQSINLIKNTLIISGPFVAVGEIDLFLFEYKKICALEMHRS